MADFSGQFSVAILTYQRNDRLRSALEALTGIRELLAQVIVVDNASDPPAAVVCSEFPWVTLVRASSNLGAAGRNLAFEASTSEFLITLDDDVVGIEARHLRCLASEFSAADIAAINFRVIEANTGRLVNWVHHRAPERYSMDNFDTYEITEGAVALRMSAIRVVGGYPTEFFLSHEGPDLAFRLINRGWRVVYRSSVEVIHSFAPQGRVSWRNYYYDTRNAFWLACRNMPVGYGARALIRQLGAMFLFSVRDGYFGTWLKAVAHGIQGIPRALSQRDVLSADAMKRLREIDAFRPSLLSTLNKRLRSRVETLDG